MFASGIEHMTNPVSIGIQPEFSGLSSNPFTSNSGGSFVLIDIDWINALKLFVSSQNLVFFKVGQVLIFLQILLGNQTLTLSHLLSFFLKYSSKYVLSILLSLRCFATCFLKSVSTKNIDKKRQFGYFSKVNLVWLSDSKQKQKNFEIASKRWKTSMN